MRHKKHWIVHTILLSLTLIGLVILYVMPSNQVKAPNLSGVIPPEAVGESASDSPSPTPMPTTIVLQPSESPQAPVFSEAVWIAVGDIMMHTPQLPGAYDKSTKRYNFDGFFNDIAPILNQGDWVIANLETPMAGVEYGYTGYPHFNAPYELGEAIKQAGFNLITTANNHSLDKGEKGLLRTLENLKSLDLLHVGTASSQEDADQLLLSEKNGITMGLLSYTYGTNGIPIPEGKPYLVSLIEEQKIIEDIKRLREAGADLVTVSLHFGIEYQTKPSKEQKRLARTLVAAGADIIAGSHPHVVQPYEVVETTDEKGAPKTGLIIYSMGNFISNQRGDTKDYGVIFKVNIRKNMTDGTISLTEIESIPTWVHRYKPDSAFRYRILPIEQTINASSDPLLAQADYDTLKENFELLRNRLDSMK